MIVIDIKVIPSSGRQEFFLDQSGTLKCFLKSVPEGGKANSELIKFLAKKLKIVQFDIEIVSGKFKKTKRIKFTTDLTKQEILQRFGVAVQQSLL